MSDTQEIITLLKALLSVQSEQKALMTATALRQNGQGRQNSQWKTTNSDLSKRCFQAHKKAGELLTHLISEVVTEIEDLDNSDSWDVNYSLFEILDKYGHKFQQFTMLLQTLSQLGTP